MLEISSTQLTAWFNALFWPFSRILALLSSAPLLAHPSVPVRVRVGLSILVSVVVAPGISPLDVSPVSINGGLLLIAQVVIGVAIGFTLQLVFAAVGLAGDMIGLQMGLSFATFVDPQNTDQTPLVGSFLSTTLMLVFLAIDGHLMLIAGVVQSFTLLPLDGGFAHFDWVALVSAGASVFTSGLQIALPVLAAMLITNLALGVLTRTAPQLNLFAVGFPVTLAIGLLFLLLILPYLAQPLTRIIERGLAPVLGT